MQAIKTARRIKPIAGSNGHKNWKGWKAFLKSCEVRDSVDGVIHYGTVNCNYILFPDGTLIQNYGYNGTALMNQVRIKGAGVLLQEYKDARKLIQQLIYS